MPKRIQMMPNSGFRVKFWAYNKVSLLIL